MLDLAGATVLRGIIGFGAGSRLHPTKYLRLSSNPPLAIEIGDGAEYSDCLLPSLDDVISEGLITIEKVWVIRYQDSH